MLFFNPIYILFFFIAFCAYVALFPFPDVKELRLLRAAFGTTMLCAMANLIMPWVIIPGHPYIRLLVASVCAAILSALACDRVRNGSFACSRRAAAPGFCYLFGSVLALIRRIRSRSPIAAADLDLRDPGRTVIKAKDPRSYNRSKPEAPASKVCSRRVPLEPSPAPFSLRFSPSHARAHLPLGLPLERFRAC